MLNVTLKTAVTCRFDDVQSKARVHGGMLDLGEEGEVGNAEETHQGVSPVSSMMAQADDGFRYYLRVGDGSFASSFDFSLVGSSV